MLKLAAKNALKHLAFATPLHRQLFNPYPFMFDPGELIFLTECVTAVKEVPGVFVEAGCAYGSTTIWLNKFMNEQGVERDYYAIDTFSGFTPEHIRYEADQRRKPRSVTSMLKSTFANNKREWFWQSMAAHGVANVIALKADVSNFEFADLAPIAFCLLDVDLFLPIHQALPKIYEALSAGGIIVVDDCWSIDPKWDGALQAYNEFTSAQHLPRDIRYRKLGVIRREL